MLIDTHAHVNFNAFKDDGDEVIRRALDNNIRIINVGSQYSTSKRAVEYTDKYPGGVYAAVGLHPMHLETVRVDLLEESGFESRREDFEFSKYKELAEKQNVVAIGEIGLDYYHINKESVELKIERREKNENKSSDKIIKEIEDRQKEIFIEQLRLAIEVDKPVIIHCRDAHTDMLDILIQAKKQSSGLRGVMHCFGGTLEQARQYVELGFLISFTGLITFVRAWDEVIQNIDLNKIMVETDCPYLTPVPFRGRRNEPLYVEYVARKVAEIKKIDFEIVANQTTRNALDLFGIK